LHQQTVQITGSGLFFTELQLPYILMYMSPRM